MKPTACPVYFERLKNIVHIFKYMRLPVLAVNCSTFKTKPKKANKFNLIEINS